MSAISGPAASSFSRMPCTISSIGRVIFCLKFSPALSEAVCSAYFVAYFVPGSLLRIEAIPLPPFVAMSSSIARLVSAEIRDGVVIPEALSPVNDVGSPGAGSDVDGTRAMALLGAGAPETTRLACVERPGNRALSVGAEIGAPPVGAISALRGGACGTRAFVIPLGDPGAADISAFCPGPE